MSVVTPDVPEVLRLQPGSGGDSLPAPPASPEVVQLRREVEELRAQLAELRSQLAEMRAALKKNSWVTRRGQWRRAFAGRPDGHPYLWSCDPAPGPAAMNRASDASNPARPFVSPAGHLASASSSVSHACA